MTKRLKRCCATLAAILATIATICAVPAAWAATTSPADIDHPTLVVRLDADGTVIVSQRSKDAGAPVTLPSVKALPAEIDTLVPQKADRRTIAVTADSTGPYANFNYLAYTAMKAGFAKVAILGVAKAAPGQPSEMTIDVRGGAPFPPPDGLFVSLGEDGQVTLSLGYGPNAHGMTVALADVPTGLTDLVPKGRAKQQVFFRADLQAPVGNALDLIRKLGAIGFKKFGLVGEQPE